MVMDGRWIMRRLRLKRESIYLVASVLLVAAAALTYYIYRPSSLRVAFVRDSEDARMLQSFAEVLQQQHRDVRLRLIPVDDLPAASGLLERREVDLAVVRPDVAMPVNGLTVAILREEAAIVLAPTAAKIENVEDLATKRLGLVSRHEADTAFISTVLGYYELAPPAVTLVPLRTDEVEAALRDKRVDAVVVIAVPGDREATAVLKAAEAATKRTVHAIAIGEGAVMAERTPALTEIKVAVGALGGLPKQPAEELATVGISFRLVARSDLDAGIVGDFTEQLFKLRPRLARLSPAANRIKAPESSMSATLPVHPGAIRYLEREQQTFFERYGDWIYLSLFCGGGVSSAFAWMTQRLIRRRRELVDEVLDRLTCILSEVRSAKTVRSLDDLAVETDTMVTHAVRYARNKSTSTRTMSTLIMAIDSVRAAIADRRRDVLDDRERTSESASDRRGAEREARPETENRGIAAAS